MSLDIDVPRFMAKHPEFSNAGTVLVSAALEDAQRLISEASFGANYTMAVEYKACMLLAAGKYGQIDPKPTKDQTDSYEKIYQDIAKRIPIRFLLT